MPRENISDRTPPVDIKAEEEVLRYMLHEDGAEARGAVRAILDDGDEFYRTYNQRIFSAILSLHDAGQPVDDFTAEPYQEIARDFRSIGGMPAVGYMEELRATAVSASVDNAIHYAEKVKEKARLRRQRAELISALKDIDNDTEITSQQIADRLKHSIALDIEEEKPTAETTPTEGILFPLDKFLPPDGFLKDYMNYMLPITEAPPQYHVFAGLMMLATAVEQRIYFEVAGRRKYLNLWAVLIGNSGCKKSTSIDTPQEILANNGFKDLVLPTQITSEKLITMLADHNAGTFFWSEWGATMDQWTKSYSQDIMSIFTALYDGGYFSRYLKNERYEIMNSAISLFCGCTPSWLRKTVKQVDVAMGFWPRFLFVPAAKRERYIANPPKGNPKLRQSIADRLTLIRDSLTKEYQDAAEIDFQNVETIYDHWYEKANRAADEDAEHHYMASFVVRLSDYVKKIAALMEISSSNSIKVRPETMGYALSLVDWLREAVIHVMSDVGSDEQSEIEKRVYDMINQAGTAGIKHSDLTSKLQRLGNSKVNQAIKVLLEAERVDQREVKKPGRGRSGKLYTASH